MRQGLVLRSFGVAVAATAIVACSSSNENAGSSGETVITTTCRAGYEWQWVDGPNGSVRQCQPTGILAVTGVPSLGFPDTCGTPNYLPVPPQLTGLGCTKGMVIDGQRVWACPSQAQASIPTAPFGLVTTGQGRCFDDNGQRLTTLDYLLGTCEATLVATSLASTCLGSPVDGWILVFDAALNTVKCDHYAGLDPYPWRTSENPPFIGPYYPFPGSCQGGCGVVLGQPF